MEDENETQLLAQQLLAQIGGQVEEDQVAPVDPVQLEASALLSQIAPQDEMPLTDQESMNAEDTVKRQLGLTGRAMVEGGAGIVGIAYDPLAYIINQVTGLEIPPLTDQVRQALTDLGVPNPETVTERVVQVIGNAMTGAGLSAKAATLASKALTSTPKVVATMLGENVGTQVTSGAGAGAAQQISAELGAPPAIQFLSALGGGFAGGYRPGATPTTEMPVNPVKPVEPPLTMAPETPPMVAPETPPMVAPETPPMVAPEVPVINATEASDATFQALVRKAALGGAGSQAAREELAKMASANPAALEAAERLGMTIAPDILSDHTQLKSAIGLARSQIGSSAETSWIESLSSAVNKADDALKAIDGSSDLSAISDAIKNNLEKTRNELKKTASSLYKIVDDKIKPSMPVNPTNSVRLLNKRITDLGGASALKGKEKELFDIITDPDLPLTYARLVTVKQDVGRALEGRGGQYDDVNEAILKRVYGALAEDQLASAASVGGEVLRTTLRLANQTTAKQKALEKRIVNAFGKDLDGSVANKIRSAISGGSRGDIAGLNRLLKTVPQDLRRETVASAIAAMSRSRRALSATIGGDDIGAPFSFAEYEKLYRALRDNSVVYKTIADVIGPDAQKVMRDLYEVSKYINDASGKIVRTGASNQALISELNAQGTLASAFNSTLGRRATQAVAGAVGAAVGSPMVGAAGGALVGALTEVGKRDGVKALGNMIASNAFKELMVQASAGNVNNIAKNKLLADPKFRTWAKLVNIEDPAAWLIGSLQGIRQITAGAQQ
jgi:hypothetical protein